MRSLSQFIFMLVFTCLSACSHKTVTCAPNSKLDNLKSLNVSKAATDADRAYSSGDRKLLGVYSVGLEVPGLAGNPDSYRDGIRTLDGTSDTPCGDQERLANVNARAYAKKYNEEVLSQVQGAELLGSVAKGDDGSARNLIGRLKDMDGGNLEDALVALGQFSDIHMDAFLAFAQQGLLSQRELTDALIMLPLSLGDDQSAQLSALQDRKHKVQHVTRTDLLEQRALALQAIDKAIDEVKADEVKASEAEK
jgi:hypothetical protein